MCCVKTRISTPDYRASFEQYSNPYILSGKTDVGHFAQDARCWEGSYIADRSVLGLAMKPGSKATEVEGSESDGLCPSTALERRSVLWHKDLCSRYEMLAKSRFQLAAVRMIDEAIISQPETLVEGDEECTADEARHRREFYAQASRPAMSAYDEQRYTRNREPGSARTVETESGERTVPCARKTSFRILLAAMEAGRHLTRLAPIRAALSDVADVFALCLPGRSQRAGEAWPSEVENQSEGSKPLSEKMPQSMLVAEARRTLASAEWVELTNQPFIVVGHGALGALFAYELVTAHCAAGGRLPRRLVVSAARPDLTLEPCDDGPPLIDRSDEALLAYFAALRRGQTPKHAFPHREEYSEQDCHGTVVPPSRVTVNRYLMSLPRPLRESAPLRKRAAECIRSDLCLLANYHPTSDWPLQCPITAVAGNCDPSISDSHLDEWRAKTTNDFRIARPPGAASYLDHAEGRTFFADLLRSIIADADANDDVYSCPSNDRAELQHDIDMQQFFDSLHHANFGDGVSSDSFRNPALAQTSPWL